MVYKYCVTINESKHHFVLIMCVVQCKANICHTVHPGNTTGDVGKPLG